MSQIKDVSDHGEDTLSQIARLREQIETLMRDKVSPAVGSAATRAQAAAGDAADILSDRADALGGAIRQQPLAAVCIAAVVGFLLGRIGR
jgi:ElaB/YqjD/DUF883 family membrane-anchored ribosome-binding protein